MLSLRSLDPLSGEVNSLATTAADSIVSRLLSEDSVAPSELSVLDISLRTYVRTYFPYYVRITYVLRTLLLAGRRRRFLFCCGSTALGFA